MSLFAKSIIVSAVIIATLVSVLVAAYDRSDRCSESDEGHEGKVYGIITYIPPKLTGTWIVNRKKILVTPHTRIKEKHGRAEEGAYVEAEGDYENDVFRACSIKVKQGRR